MDKEKFSKIRNAAREVAGQVMRQQGRVGVVMPSHIHAAFDHFRQVRSEEGEGKVQDDIEYWSATHDLRKKIGHETFRLLVNVMEEKWSSTCKRVLQESRSAIGEVEPGAARMALARKLYLDAAREHDRSVAVDPRIRRAFRGKDELLKEAQTVISSKLQPIFERDLAISEFQKEDDDSDTRKH